MQRFLIMATIVTLMALAFCYLMGGLPMLVGGLLGIPVATAIIVRRHHAAKR